VGEGGRDGNEGIGGGDGGKTKSGGVCSNVRLTANPCGSKQSTIRQKNATWQQRGGVAGQADCQVALLTSSPTEDPALYCLAFGRWLRGKPGADIDHMILNQKTSPFSWIMVHQKWLVFVVNDACERHVPLAHNHFPTYH
jgi:hypothetical protein